MINIAYYKKLKKTIENRTAVSVKDFGAVGDGVTDDTQAIQDAIDYAKAGSTLYIPSCKNFYKIDKGNILVDKPLYILGCGKEGKIKVADQSKLFHEPKDDNDDWIMNTVFAAQTGNVIFDNLYIDGNNKNNYEEIDGEKYYRGDPSGSKRYNLIHVNNYLLEKEFENITIKNCIGKDPAHGGFDVRGTKPDDYPDWEGTDEEWKDWEDNDIDWIKNILFFNNKIMECKRSALNAQMAKNVIYFNNKGINNYWSDLRVYRFAETVIMDNNLVIANLDEMDMWEGFDQEDKFSSIRIGHSYRQWGTSKDILINDNNIKIYGDENKISHNTSCIRSERENKDITIKGNKTFGGDTGVRTEENGDNHTIIKNTIVRCKRWGFLIGKCNGNTVVDNNIVFENLDHQPFRLRNEGVFSSMSNNKAYAHETNTDETAFQIDEERENCIIANNYSFKFSNNLKDDGLNNITDNNLSQS